MTLRLGTEFPDFAGVPGPNGGRFTEWQGEDWALVFAFKSLSPTCSSEFLALERLHGDYRACGARVLGISVDADDAVAAWLDDLREIWGCVPSFALLNDTSGRVPALLGWVDEQSAALSLSRSAYLVSPDRRIVMALSYPVTNGRSFDEILRTLRAARLTAEKRVATSATWTDGEPVMLPPSLSQDQAERMYPAGVQVLRPYLRIVAQP